MHCLQVHDIQMYFQAKAHRGSVLTEENFNMPGFCWKKSMNDLKYELWLVVGHVYCV